LVTVFTGFPIHVPVEWAVNGLLFCSAVGLAFGMWPAMKASKLAPIEALRWE
jgi:putative ABC transport system permease protein